MEVLTLNQDEEGKYVDIDGIYMWNMWDIYAILCDEIAGTCKNCSLMKKRGKK